MNTRTTSPQARARSLPRRPGPLLELCLVLIALPALGQAPGYGPPDQQVEAEADNYVSPIVISPSRAEQKEFEADRTVRVITRDDLASTHVQTAPEALHDAAGVTVQKTNRGAGAPLLRGLVGPRNLLVIDGVRFSNSTFRTGPNQYLSLLDPSAQKQFEVLMGPASVVYGTDAMGGVLAASPWATRRKDGVGGRAGVDFLSADMSTSVHGTAGFKSGDLGLRAGGALRRFGTLTGGGGNQLLLSDYMSGAWHLRTRYDISKRTWVGASWFGARIRDAGRTDRINEGRFRLYDNDSDIGWLELRHRGNGTLRSLRVVASAHRTWEGVDRFRCSLKDPLAERAACIEDGLPARTNNDHKPTGNVSRHEQWEDTVLTPGLLVISQLRLTDDISATAGLEAHQDTVSSTFRQRRSDKDDWAWKDADRGHFSEGSTYAQGGVFALAEAGLLKTSAGRLAITAGARYSIFSASAAGVPQFGDVAYQQQGVAGSLGVKWQAGDRWMAWVNASQGLRAPNLQESTVLGDTGSKIEVPNADLEAESSLAVEAGARLQGKTLRLAVVGFANMLSDTIDERELDKAEWQKLGLEDSEVGNKPVVQRINSGAGRFFGGEAQVEASVASGVQLWLRGSVIQGEIDRKDGSTVTARRNPPPMGNAGASWRVPGVDGLSIAVYSRFSAAQSNLHPSDESDLRICEDPSTPGDTFKDNKKDCAGSPSWVTANLRATYRFSKQLRLDVSGLNLLDAQYRYHGSGIDEPGRGVAVSVNGRM